MLKYNTKTNLMLITPDEYDAMPDGVVLHSVDGEIAVKGFDDIDWSTRWSGHLGWGFMAEWISNGDDWGIHKQRGPRASRIPREDVKYTGEKTKRPMFITRRER